MLSWYSFSTILLMISFLRIFSSFLALWLFLFKFSSFSLLTSLCIFILSLSSIGCKQMEIYLALFSLCALRPSSSAPGFPCSSTPPILLWEDWTLFGTQFALEPDCLKCSKFTNNCIYRLQFRLKFWGFIGGYLRNYLWIINVITLFNLGVDCIYSGMKGLLIVLLRKFLDGYVYRWFNWWLY